MMPVRLKPAAPQSRVKQSTTEQLRSHKQIVGTQILLGQIGITFSKNPDLTGTYRHKQIEDTKILLGLIGR